MPAHPPPHQHARPGARPPFAAPAPSTPLAHPQPPPPVPSTPPPSYTPKDPLAPDDRIPSQYRHHHHPHHPPGGMPPPPPPLTPSSSSSAAAAGGASIARPPSRRCSNPPPNNGSAAAIIPAFSTPESQAQAHATAQVHARRRSSAAATRMALGTTTPLAAASAPDLSRTLSSSREDPGGESSGGGGGGGGGGSTQTQDASANAEPPSSALHPRVAVLLGVKESFHVPLLLCRGLATAPPLWWFARCVGLFWRLVVSALRGGVERDVAWGVAGWRGGGVGGGGGAGLDGEAASLVITEVGLAALWCTASGYLSFYFADCLMSRWLLNYTPTATLVRLFTLSAINVYTASWWLHLSGASSDPRLLLPAWICVASTLTILYHVTHRHVNIRRETRAAVRAFYVSSSISLFMLLLQSHLERGTWRVSPLVAIVEKVVHAWRDARVPPASDGGREL